MATTRSHAFYFDEMMSRRVMNELIKQGYDVVMAVDVGMESKPDPEHLAYATKHHRTLVTRDKPFAGRAMKQSDHQGVICWNGEADDFGGQVRAITAFAEEYSPDDAAGQVFWLK